MPARAGVVQDVVAHGATPLPDLARAGEVLLQLRALWPEENVTPYVGLNLGRVCVGFITDRHRGAIRFTSWTLEGAFERAAQWTSRNAWRMRWESENDRLEHPKYRQVPPKSEHPKED